MSLQKNGLTYIHTSFTRPLFESKRAIFKKKICRLLANVDFNFSHYTGAATSNGLDLRNDNASFGQNNVDGNDTKHASKVLRVSGAELV